MNSLGPNNNCNLQITGIFNFFFHGRVGSLRNLLKVSK